MCKKLLFLALIIQLAPVRLAATEQLQHSKKSEDEWQTVALRVTAQNNALIDIVRKQQEKCAKKNWESWHSGIAVGLCCGGMINAEYAYRLWKHQKNQHKQLPRKTFAWLIAPTIGCSIGMLVNVYWWYTKKHSPINSATIDAELKLLKAHCLKKT